MATNYNGQLKANELYTSIFNMIISQEVISDNIKGTYSSLVEKFRAPGTLYGDTMLKYNGDILYSQEWLGDNEAQNLLQVNRAEDPKCQAITLDQFRMVFVTVSDYLEKRAWSTEGAFSSFNSFILSQLGETKKVYESTMMNVYVGNTVSEADRAVVEIGVAAATQGLSGEEKSRVKAQTIAQGIADLMVDLKDISRDFNDYKHLQSYDESQLMVVWNSKYVNEITKLDLPTVFHKDGLFNDFSNVLPARYFGEVGTDAIAKANNDGTKRSTIEADYASAVGGTLTHVFPGDLIPSGTCKVLTYNEGAGSKYRTGKLRATAKTISDGIAAGDYYTVKDDVICKIMAKDAIVYMSAFTTENAFFNNRSLSTNHYLIFGYSTPAYLHARPFITVEED